jgi:hypothetical protein
MRVLFAMIAGLGLLSACTFTMVGNAPKTEDTRAQSRTINASFAGSEQFVNMCEDQEADLAEVRFHTNPVYLVASIVTLGLYVPQNVTWWCGVEEAECTEDDTREECQVYVPGGD